MYNYCFSEYDLHMAKGVKDFQKDFTREVHSIRDEWNMFELNLGEFKKNLKACVPNGIADIRTMKVILFKNNLSRIVLLKPHAAYHLI